MGGWCCFGVFFSWISRVFEGCLMVLGKGNVSCGVFGWVFSDVFEWKM